MNQEITEKIIILSGNQYDFLFIFFADYLKFLVPLVLLSMFLYSKKDRINSIIVFTVSMLTYGLNKVIEFVTIHTPRPFTVYNTILEKQADSSFPSGHTAILAGFSFSLYFLGYRKLGSIFIFLTVLQGFSRVYVGYHYVYDIIFSLILGMIISFIFINNLLK